MKLKHTLPLFVSLFTLQAFAQMTLKDSFEAARKNMETLKRAEATVQQSEELKIRARAAALPTIAGVGSYTRIDKPDAAGSSPFLLTKQYSYALRLQQPLIRGGILSAYQLAKENVLLSKFQKDASEITLYQLVINAYYNLQAAQQDVKNLEEFMRYSKERVKELEERTKIGRSRQGELVEAEAQALSAESQHKQGIIALQSAEKTFSFYTLLEPKEIGVLPDFKTVSGSLTQFTNRLRDRPDIKASQQQVRVAERQVQISKGGHYPSLDLTANYYIDRTGVLATSDWDVGFALVIPLYQGGGVQAAVKESVEAKRIAELTQSETMRAAERDVIISYQNLLQVQEQLNYTKSAMKRFEEAYKLNRRDYKNGLVTNLDVLQSLSYYIDSKRAYANLVAMAHMNAKNLEAQTGVLP